jgi:hypothetical protein
VSGSRDGRPQEFAKRYESYFRRALPDLPARLIPKSAQGTSA